MRVLTIGSPELVMKEFNFDVGISRVLRFFAFLPFSISCLFKTPPPHEHSYSPEYIVPQMLMNFIKKSNIYHGVRYPSTKFSYSSNIMPAFNYAFPVKDPDSDGFCRFLKEKFDWTDPILSQKDFKRLESELANSAGKIENSDNF